MRYLFTTKELLTLLRSSGREPSEASPFRTLLTLNAPTEEIPLKEDERLLCIFALAPERVWVMGRHSTVDGELYVLKIGAIHYLYTWLEKQDLHVFEAYFDRPRLLAFLQRNFCSYFRPNFAAFTHLSVSLTHDEFTVFNLIRALYASRAQGGTGHNDPFPADDLKNPDLALYLRNYLDETGFSALSDRIDLLMDEKKHAEIDHALKGLEEKGLLSVDPGEDPRYRLTRTAIERAEDGLLTDTLFFADRTKPAKGKEMLLCLRRDGVLALIPHPDGVALRTFEAVPWEELLL